MNKTMICLILDRSGSMAGLEKDVIGGVNSFLEEQKQLPDPATFCAVRFDSSDIERFVQLQNLQHTQPLKSGDFVPRGGTPLLDAIGQTIRQLDHDWQEIQPDRCIVVIYTDGQENSSKEYSKATVKKMIEQRQGSGKWGFVFLGANIDAVGEAASLGIWTTNAAKYENSHGGLKSAYAATSATVGFMRSSGSTVANLGGDIPAAQVEKTPK